MAIARDERLENAVAYDNRPSQPWSNTSHMEPWRDWPTRDGPNALRFKQLEQYIINHPGRKCKIRKLIFRRNSAEEYPRWQFNLEANSLDDLRLALNAPDDALVLSELYLIMQMDAEPMQLLGQHLNLDPRFFNMPWSESLRTGQSGSDCMHFGLPLMDKLDRRRPSEDSSRTDLSSEPILDAEEEGEPDSIHNVMPDWHYTRINSCLTERPAEGRIMPVGVFVFDWDDAAIRQALETFGGRFNEHPEAHIVGKDWQIKYPPASLSHRSIAAQVGKCGLSNIVTELLYIVQVTWVTFVKEAQIELNKVDKQCITPGRQPDELIKLTRTLHTLRLKLGEAHRRMVLFQGFIEYVQENQYFRAITDEYIPFKVYTGRSAVGTKGAVQDCLQLVAQASTLTSLIYNINAIEEGKVSNTLASSMRRVATLTFIYLPLMLVASILGMNVEEIVGPSQALISIWVFFVIAVPITLLTFLVWAMWARSSRISRALRRIPKMFQRGDQPPENTPKDDGKMV